MVRYQPDAERMDFVAELARRWAELARKPNAEKRVALVLANYPTSDGRIGNGVGLDTPASALGILAALGEAGYTLAGPLPETGDALIARLTEGVTNDPTSQAIRPAFAQSLALDDYRRLFRAPAGGRARGDRGALGRARAGPDAAPRTFHDRRLARRAGVRRHPAGARLRARRTTTRATTMPTSCRRTPIWRSTSGCATPSRSTRSCTSASTATSNGCRARASALSDACWPDVMLGPLPNICIRSSSTIRARAARPSAAPRR